MFGGGVRTNIAEVSNVVDMYVLNVANGTFSYQQALLQTKRYNHASASCGQYGYFAGGATVDESILSSIEIFAASDFVPTSTGYQPIISTTAYNPLLSTTGANNHHADKKKKGNDMELFIIIGSVAGFLILVVGTAVALLMIKKRRNNNRGERNHFDNSINFPSDEKLSLKPVVPARPPRPTQ